MSNTKTTKRALLTSVMALMLCFAMLTGTTFAWFTDTETSSNNRIVAGTLDVDLLMDKEVNGTYTSIAGGSGDIFSEGATANNSTATVWEPGKTQIVYLAVANLGNLALKYNIILNVTDEDATDSVNLADVLEFAVVDFGKTAPADADRITAWDANATVPTIGSLFIGESNTILAAPNGQLEVGEKDYFALAVHMQEEAGNEYQGKAISIDITVNATQLASENDAFGTDYDVNSEFAVVGFGSVAVNPTQTADYEVPVKESLKTTPNSTSQVGHAKIPVAAVADDASSLKVTIEEQDETYEGVTVTSDQGAVTYDISVEGLKDGNTTPVQISLRIGANYSGVKVFHKDTEIPSSYNGNDVVFSSTEFSPFTIVYDAEYVAPDDDTLPKATVTVESQYKGKSDFGSFGNWAPTPGVEATLDAAFMFTLSDELMAAVENSTYKNWLCDFYVSLDRDLGPNQIFLAGQYGTYPWIGFHNGNESLPKNTEVPLLGYAIGQGVGNWTYADVANFVTTFLCGVGDVNGGLDGAVFTVDLRLVNPDDNTDYVNVNTVKYKFGSNIIDIDGQEVPNN